jgi:hypothetical protein
MLLVGTSSAAPAAAGIALMIRQYFEDDQAVFWLAVCASKYKACSPSFVPSGVLIKAVLLHSGGAMNQYFDSASSKEIMLASPPDFIQGQLSSSFMIIIACLSSSYHCMYTTGYGRVGLKSVLPLAQRPSNKYDLFVYDQATILPDQTLTFAVTVSTASRRLK